MIINNSNKKEEDTPCPWDALFVSFFFFFFWGGGEINPCNLAFNCPRSYFPFCFQVLILILIYGYGATSCESNKECLLSAVSLLVLQVLISYLLFSGRFFPPNIWWQRGGAQGIRIPLRRTASRIWDLPTWNPFGITWKSVSLILYAVLLLLTHYPRTVSSSFLCKCILGHSGFSSPL